MRNLPNTKSSTPKPGATLYRNGTNKAGEPIAFKFIVRAADSVLTRGQLARQCAGFKKAFGTPAPAAAVASAQGDPDEYTSTCYLTSTTGQRVAQSDLSEQPVGKVIG